MESSDYDFLFSTKPLFEFEDDEKFEKDEFEDIKPELNVYNQPLRQPVSQPLRQPVSQPLSHPVRRGRPKGTVVERLEIKRNEQCECDLRGTCEVCKYYYAERQRRLNKCKCRWTAGIQYKCKECKRKSIKIVEGIPVKHSPCDCSYCLHRHRNANGARLTRKELCDLSEPWMKKWVNVKLLKGVKVNFMEEIPIHICDACLPSVRTFVRTSHLRYHIKHHSTLTKYEFACTILCNGAVCDRSFTRPDLYWNHLTNFHNIIPVDICKCGKKFVSNSQYNRHLLVCGKVIDQKPFSFVDTLCFE
jgi:hypothetical protein